MLSEYLWIPIIGTFVSFFTSWAIGANDCANSFATSVGAKVLTLKDAVIIAAIFEFLGAFLMGSQVTDTVRKKIVDNLAFEDEPELLMWGMFCSLFASGIWITIATTFKLPVSTTHSIIGSIVGFSLAAKGSSIIDWGKIIEIAISWIISPVLAGMFAVCIFSFIKYTALIRENPLQKLYIIYPLLIFILFFINSLFIIYKGTPSLNLDDTSLVFSISISLGIGIFFALIGHLMVIKYFKPRMEIWILNKEEQDIEVQSISITEQFENKTREICYNNDLNREQNFKQIYINLQELKKINIDEKIIIHHSNAEVFDESAEKMCSYLQIVTACFSAFAHGSNDVANSIAPLATCWAIYEEGSVTTKVDVPIWILLVGGSGIVFGLATWGYKIIERVGRELTKVTPSRGFSMEMGDGIAVIIASRMELPVSTTHCQIGSVFCVGLLDGTKNVNFNSLLKIILSWIVTLPITGLISAMLYSFGRYSP